MSPFRFTGTLLPPPMAPGRLLVLMIVLSAGLFLTFAPLPLAGAALAGSSLLVLLLYHPVSGLWLLPFTIPFGTLPATPLENIGLSAAEILIGLTFCAWLAQGVAQRRLVIKIPPLFIPLSLLLGAMLLSVPGMLALSPTIRELAKWIEILVVYGLVFQLVDRQRTGWILLGSMVAATSVSALHGIAGALLRTGPPAFAILGGRLTRAAGTFGQPNPFGGYMNHSLPIIISLLIAIWLAGAPLLPGQQPFSTHRQRLQVSTTNFFLLTGLLGSGGIIGAGLILSWSRGAWLGAAFGLATVILAWPIALLLDRSDEPAAQSRRQRAIGFLGLLTALLILVALIGGLNLVPPAITTRLESALATFTTLDARGAKITHANFATLERVAHWQAAWDMWRDHFWTGIGIGNYEVAYDFYRLPKWPYALGHAHNIYFNMAAETGFLGLLAYLGWVGAALWHCWHVASRSQNPLGRGVAIGMLGVLIALGVHNLFDNMYVHRMGLHIALGLGLVSCLGRRPTAPV